MMEKNAVVGSTRSINTKIASHGCPACGSKLDLDGSLPRCPKHGTAPFERGAGMSRTPNTWKRNR
jgi:hypothetical protein